MNVSLDEAGKPTYEILKDVAWDYLSFTPELSALAQTLYAACFGVLGQRSVTSRQTIRTLLRKMPRGSLKILDVNLREPFFSKTLVEESLELATVLKLSDEELPVLASYFELTGSVMEQLVILRERFDLALVAYTRGADGSILVGAQQVDTTGGIKTTMVDTVGAGDSFTASLCMGLLKEKPLAEINVFANRVAAFVCSQKGACPILPDHLHFAKTMRERDSMDNQTDIASLEAMSEEQLPIAKHKLHGWTHFLGLYAGEHVAATEFVIGATFVALGAKTTDILIGLLIGNVLAILSWTLITAPIATQTRLSLYMYLDKIAGGNMTKLYNWANVLIFTVISAAMITVSSTAVRFLFDIPAQLKWYPTDVWFVLVVLAVGAAVVFVAMYGFSALAEFSGICAPWLVIMFLAGALVMMPALSHAVLGHMSLSSFTDFITIGDSTIWTGVNALGKPGIGLLEVIGFAWAANTITHFGLIDMALFRYARKSIYGLCTSSGMLFGHYIAWIAAGIMGAGTAVLVKKSIIELDPGDVAYHALGLSGFVIVIIAGWTTANANLYRAGLAAQAIFYKHSRKQTTLAVGVVTMIVACFPFVFTKMLPMLTYAGLIVVPVGAIVFTEHFIFPRIGFTRYWVSYRKLVHSTPAVASWGVGLVFGFGLNALDVISFYYLFIPTWFVTIITYTLLAKLYGADKAYPTEQAAMEKHDKLVVAYHDHQAAIAKPMVKDNSILTRTLQSLAWVSLFVTLVLALNTMFRSTDMDVYTQNCQTFYRYGFICTIVYFVSAYWALRRNKSAQKSTQKTATDSSNPS